MRKICIKLLLLVILFCVSCSRKTVMVITKKDAVYTPPPPAPVKRDTVPPIDKTQIRPLQVGDKVPNIPFKILDVNTGKTTVVMLYDIMNGSADSILNRSLPDTTEKKKPVAPKTK